MKYRLLYHPHCLKRLKKIPTADRKKILTKLIKLANNPFNQALNIKKLTTTKKGYRLRAGNLRAIYELNQPKKIIYIWEIDYRGNIY